MAEQRRGERVVQHRRRAHRADRGALARVASLRVALVAAVPFVGGCGEVEMRIGPGIQIGTGTGSHFGHHSLVGLWTRVVVITDGAGNSHSSRTTWEFRSDGSATRTVVTQNLTLGVSDVMSTNATWRAEGFTLVITFRPPDNGMTRFSFTLFGDVLTLNGHDFFRIG